MKTKTTTNLKKVTTCLATLLAVLAAPAAFAASQSWVANPVDAQWVTGANWLGGAAPGALNITGNNVNNDTATFSNAIPGSLIGSATTPILIDNNPTVGNRGRQLGSILLTGDAGPYVFSTASALNYPSEGLLFLSHNGSITVGATVTNKQHFLVPIYIRLPGSTAGIYNFVNNATDANATLYINTATNDSANTRGTDFRLGGSNTGTNSIGILSAGTTTSGANGFTKQGSGTWTLLGDNDFRSQTVVRIIDGKLIVKSAGAFQGASTATITNSTLQLDGIILNQFNLNLHNGGILLNNGLGGVNGIVVGNHVGTLGTLATTSASDVFTIGGASVVSGGAVDSLLVTDGPGTVYFASANTYVGSWSFKAATNQFFFPDALGAGANANVAAGAVFDITGYGAAGFIPTTTGFGGSGLGTAVGSTAATVLADAAGTLDLTGKNVNLTYTPSSISGDLSRPALYIAQGTLGLSGNTFFINNASGNPLGVGTYRLIQQANGSIASGGGYAALVGGSGLVAGGAASIQVSGGNVDMVVTIYVPKNLVWSGSGSVWNLGMAANWLDGVTPSVFNNADNVTFNSVGVANSNVDLNGTLAPASVRVDSSGGDYSFAGGGQIAGTASLTKVGSGMLTIQTVNTYAGGTVISNGTVRVGQGNALSSVGSGDVAIYGSGLLDLNGFNNVINGLSGNGSVDEQSGGTSTLTIGNNNNNGTFSGQIKNSTGTLNITKAGTGTQVLIAANTYGGNTTVSAGTLAVGNPTALGIGPLIVNAGTVDVTTDLYLASLAGAGGTIANNANAVTNTITVSNAVATTYSGNIVNGTGGGGVAVRIVNGNSLTLGGNNTYTGGTFVGSGSTFAIPNSPAAVGGFVIASNNATLNLSGGSGTPGTPNLITTVPGAFVTFNSGAEGKIWAAQFNGSLNSTNFYIGPVSFGQSLSFSNFPGVVVFSNNTANSNIRFFNGGGISGGENTTFVFQHCNVHTRDAQSVRLGEIIGGNTFAGIGDQVGIVSWEIGAKNTSTMFSGYFAGVNNSFVKVGTGMLTLDGRLYSTNTVTLPDSSVVEYPLFTDALSYLGSTTVSNGTLKIVAPNNLNTSSNINLAGGVLDATQIGFHTNQTTLDINAIEQATNSVSVVSGVVEILASQTLNGFGSILGSVTLDATAVNNVGDHLAVGGALTRGIGTMSVSGTIALNGTVNMDLNRNSVQTSDRITAASRTGTGATLNVSNLGPNLVTGDVYQLFNGPVTAFTTVNLPVATADNSITYVWENNLAVDGTIKVLSGASPVDPTPTTITSTVVGNVLELAWPSSHKGWTLQAQTNALSVGLSGTWFNVADSENTNQVFIPINPANPTVFYRLTLPQP
jgi:fibronectin-binding autotransporter adhesin